MYYVPLCYGTGEIDGMGGPALLLDDFSARNLRVTGKEVFHSVPQVEISLRALAEFHAVSQAMMTKGDLVESQEPMLVDMLKAEGTVLEDFFCKPIQGSVLLLREAIGKFGILSLRSTQKVGLTISPTHRQPNDSCRRDRRAAG